MSTNNRPVPVAGAVAVGSADNIPGVIFPTAARDQTTDSGLGAGIYASGEIQNPECRGVRLYTTATIAGGGSVTIKIQVKNPYTDAWVDLTGAAGAAIAATGSQLVTVYPGISGIADNAGNVNQHLGSSWRVIATVVTATETFSVAGDYLV